MRRMREENKMKQTLNAGSEKIPADQRYNSGLSKSGVVGVTWKKDNKKWQATYKKKYIGLYDTVEQAVKAIQEERERLSQ